MGGFSHYYPEYYDDQQIKFRIPYHMPGSLIVRPEVAGGIVSGVQFPEATFLHNVDKPFEIHRVHVELTAFQFDEDGEPTIMLPVQPETLDKRVLLRMRDTAKNEDLTKNRGEVATMVDALTRTWEWDMPYTIVRQEGFTVAVDTEPFFDFCAADPDGEEACAVVPIPVDAIRVEVAFQGYLVVLRPANGR